jgi:hypothetical protein
MLDGKIRPPGSELLRQDQQDQREREPANEPAECLGRDMGISNQPQMIPTRAGGIIFNTRIPLACAR